VHRFTDYYHTSAHHFASAVKSRIIEAQTQHIENLDIWQRSFTSLFGNLAAMRLIPFYFPYISSFKNRPVESDHAVLAMRRLTLALRDKAHPDSAHYVVQSGMANTRSICDGNDSKYCLGCRGLSELLLANTRVHVESMLPNDPNVEMKRPSSWCGFMASESFYLNGVLGLWNGGLPIEPKMFRRLLKITQKDIESSNSEMMGNPSHRSLWFWKVFVASYALSTVPVSTKQFLYQTDSLYDHGNLDKQNVATQNWFNECIRVWSRVTFVVEWRDAEAALLEVVWPDSKLVEPTARSIWTQAISPIRKNTACKINYF
jgi:hypothetical protein